MINFYISLFSLSFGSQFSIIALPLILIEVDAGTVLLGILMAVRLCPDVIIAPTFRSLLDRFHPSHTIFHFLIIQSLIGLAIFLNLIYDQSIVLLGFLIFLQSSFKFPVIALRAKIVQIKFNDAIEREIVNSKVRTIQQVGLVLGPMLAALLLSFDFINVYHLMLIDFFSYFCSAIFIFNFKVDYLKEEIKLKKRSNLFKEILEMDNVVKNLTLIGFFSSLFYFPIIQITTPYKIIEIFKNPDQIYSISLSMIASGSILGAILFKYVRKIYSLSALFLLCYILASITSLILVLSTSKSGIFSSFFILGVLSSILLIIISTIQQNIIPKDKIVSTMILMNSVVVLSSILGYLLTSYLIESFNYLYTGYAFTLSYVISAFLALFFYMEDNYSHKKETDDDIPKPCYKKTN